MNSKYIVFHIDGGIGKNIVATSVVASLKKEYPDRKIIITTAWVPVWELNTDVHRVFGMNNIQYFYDDYINSDTIIIKHNPYDDPDYIKGKKHLIDVWCNLCEVPVERRLKLCVNPREEESISRKLALDGSKEICVIQTNGGANNQGGRVSWARDLPIQTAQSVINAIDKSKTRIIHIRREDQPKLSGVEWYDLNLREIFALIKVSNRRLLIDSFCQHAAKAFELKSTVCWVINSPDVLGYYENENITPKIKRAREFNRYGYLFRDDIAGGKDVSFPYDTMEIFDNQEIIMKTWG